MSEIKPLLTEKQQSRLGIFKKYKWLILAVVIIFGALFWAGATSDSTVFNYVLGQESNLETEDNRVNVLLLGIAGKGHDGPNLTDTIIVASYDLSTKKVSLISLPRDLWLDGQKIKVNVLYQTGLNKGSGLSLPKEEIGKILGLKIPYAVRVDFSGFTRAVDLVGGIDVEVERTFDDYSYPVPGKENELCGFKEEERDINNEQAKALGIEAGRVRVLLDPQGQIATASAKPAANIVYTDLQVFRLFPCRFEHLSFKQGLTSMDGETALKFVRSRHGTNNEGTDFARSKRQQLVIAAFKNKVFSAETLFSPQKMINLAKTLGDSVEMDIPQSQYMEFLKLAKKTEGVKSYVINGEGKEPLLITPPVWQYGAWVLIPPNNDYGKIHQYVDDVLSGAFEASSSAKITPAK